MKKLFLIIAVVMFTLTAMAQDPFACITEGTTLSYRTADHKDRETQTTTTYINSVSGAKGNYEITQTVSVFQNGNIVFGPKTMSAIIEGGNTSIALGGGSFVEITGDIPVLPTDLKVGAEMPVGDIKINSLGIIMTQQITSNKCIAEEDITTPAGTFHCFVVERKYMLVMGIIKMQGSDKVWYARGVGNVKTEVYNKKGKLASTQLLVEIKK